MLLQGGLKRVEVSFRCSGGFTASAAWAAGQAHGASHLADSVEAAGDEAGGDESSGFGAVDGFDEFGGGWGAFGFDVHDLAADHAGREFGVEVSDTAYAGADGEGYFAEDRYRCGGWSGEIGDGLEGEGLQGVAGEDGGGFAEEDVAGGLAAAKVVVVEGGEVVVDEGVGVEHLEGGTEVGDAFGIVAGACDHAGGLHAEYGAETFAAGEGAVAHGAVDGVRQGVGCGQEAFEGGIGELRAGEEQGLYGGEHQTLMINQRVGDDLCDRRFWAGACELCSYENASDIHVVAWMQEFHIVASCVQGCILKEVNFF